MLFALLALATPRIGPPPNVGPLKPELELDFEGEAPGEIELSSVSEASPEEAFPEEALLEEASPEEASLEEGLLGSTLARGSVFVPACCRPGVGPNTGPLFKPMSV